MTDHDYKAIADRLVERGILIRYVDHPESPLYCLDESGKCVPGGCYSIDVYPAEQLCHSWLVAGACMERYARRFEGELKKHYPEEQLCTVFSLSGKYTCSFSGSKFSAKSDSFPLAIILAYLEATDGA